MTCEVMNETRRGFAFNNPDLTSNNGWGSIITPDELRYVYLWGNPLVATTGETYTDEVLGWYIKNAIFAIEKDLNVDFFKRRRRHRENVFGQGRNYTESSFDGCEAFLLSTVDISAGIALTTPALIKIAVDGSNFVLIDCSGGTSGTYSAQQIAQNINTELGQDFVIVHSTRDGKEYIKVVGKKRVGGSVELIPPGGDLSDDDITEEIFGLSITGNNYNYVFNGWVEEQDFFWEEPYDFDRKKFNEFIYLKLRARPVQKIYKCEFRDVAGGMVANILDWVKPNYEKGSLEFFPHTGALASLPLYAGSSFPLAQAYQSISNYPDAFFIDYDSGFENVLNLRAKWSEVFRICGMVAAIDLLNDYGDGRAAAIASASLGLAGISESYSTTMSATNAMFGARIISYQKIIKEFYKENKRKYAGLLLGAI